MDPSSHLLRGLPWEFFIVLSFCTTFSLQGSELVGNVVECISASLFFRVLRSNFGKALALTLSKNLMCERRGWVPLSRQTQVHSVDMRT